MLCFCLELWWGRRLLPAFNFRESHLILLSTLHHVMERAIYGLGLLDTHMYTTSRLQICQHAINSCSMHQSSGLESELYKMAKRLTVELLIFFVITERFIDFIIKVHSTDHCTHQFLRALTSFYMKSWVGRCSSFKLKSQ